MPGEGAVRVVPISEESTVVGAFEGGALSIHIPYNFFHGHALEALGHALGEEEDDNDGDGYSLDTLESVQVGVSDRSAQKPYSPMKHEESVS